MSFNNFASIQGFVVLETGLKQKLGIATIPHELELSHIVLTLYKHGANVGSEQLRINLYANDRYDSPFKSSGWVSIADIEDLSTNWLGWLRFDFERRNISLNQVVYVEIESQNYTRNADTFYLGIGLDDPVRFNTITSGSSAPAAMQIIGYR